MKKFLAILLTCVLLSALLVTAVLTASAKKDEFSYLELTHPADLLGTDKFVRWVIPWDEIFEDGQQYTFFANVRFGSDITASNGCVYLNIYAYSSIDDARSGNFDTLVSWYDYAKSPADAGGSSYPDEWHEYSFTYNPMLRTYGSPYGETVKLEAVYMGIGYYNATGTVGVRELGVKNDKGEVIYSQTFDYGLDFDEPNFYHSDDINAQTEGEGWSIKNAKKETQQNESSEEPEPVVESSEEPEPVVESSEEPEPVVESSEEPEPVVESSEEPEPVAESSEEPAPVESTDEPAPAESTDASAPAESTASEAPAESNGPAPWIWIIIGACALAVVIAVVLVLVMKKRKAS